MSGSSNTSHVTVCTDDFRMEGFLHVGLKAQDHKGRVSDALNDEAGFVVLTEVVIHGRGSGEGAEEPRHCATVILRKGEVKFVIPSD